MRTIHPQHNVIPVPHILFHFTAVGYDPSGVLMTRQASSERQYLLKKRCPAPDPRRRCKADVGQRNGGAQLTSRRERAARAPPPIRPHHPRVLPMCTPCPCAPGRMPACPTYSRALRTKPLPPRTPSPPGGMPGHPRAATIVPVSPAPSPDRCPRAPQML